MQIACLQHVPHEGPATLVDWARTRGHVLRPLRVFMAEPLYRIEQAEMLIIMGGPMGVHDETEHPWLAAEKRAIATALESGLPVIGFCLGAQLIAHVLGAEVTRNPEPEIGWYPIEPVSDRYLDGPLQVLHWHGDTFALPSGAELLARSAACTNQGFLLGDRIMAWQCHPEATPAITRSWVQTAASDLVDAPFVQDAERIVSEPESTYTRMHEVLYRALDEFTAPFQEDAPC